MPPYETMSFHLETERLILRPWAESDAAEFTALLTERGKGTPAVEDIRTAIANLLAATATTGIALLPVQRRDEGDFIGYCGLIIGRTTIEEPEIAYELCRRVHGRGYATEAAAASSMPPSRRGASGSGRRSAHGTHRRSVSWRSSGSSGIASPPRTPAKWLGSPARCPRCIDHERC